MKKNRNIAIIAHVDPVRNKPPQGGCRHSVSGGRISNGVDHGKINIL